MQFLCLVHISSFCTPHYSQHYMPAYAIAFFMSCWLIFMMYIHIFKAWRNFSTVLWSPRNSEQKGGYKVLRQNDIEKRSAVLENVAGFARLDAYVYDPLTNSGIGVCLYIGEANFPFPWTLSKCHQRWVPRGSDTSARPRVWLRPIGVLCQEVRKNSVGRRRRIWKSETR